jgi:competence protein ComEA
MKKFIKLLRSVLLCTLIVVCICGCNKGTAQYISSDEKGTSELTEVQTQEISTEHSQQENVTETKLIYVYICGAVKSPGVYTLSEGSRICDLFEKAEGLTEYAAIDYWNQARLLVDGEMIYVPTTEEVEEIQWNGLDSSTNQTEATGADNTSGKININTASKEQLMEIPGIGEAKAKAIINYRETNGGFTSIEEVMNIEGVKEGVFSKMKEYIVVN